MASSGGVAQWWEEYKEDGSREARDELILHYSGLVKYVASRVAAELPGHETTADLASYGVFGLINAIERFEPDRGLTFETYAMVRIRGAIIDELRSIDWVPRSVRARAKAVEQAYQRLEAELHRAPTDAELAAAVELTAAQLRRTLQDISQRGVISLDEPVRSSSDSGTTAGDEVIDLTDGPADVVEHADVRRSVAAEIARMPERERTLLSLYYVEGLTLAEIGSIMGVTASRVCQIHAKAVLHLRARMTADEHQAA